MNPSVTGTILLIEDEDSIRESLAELVRDHGYMVHTAPNGIDAMDVLRRIDRPDVILLDLMMPAMNGSDLLAVLRLDETLADVPIIVMSAWLHRWTARITGADHVMPKPINTEQLLELLKRYCSDPSAERRKSS